MKKLLTIIALSISIFFSQSSSLPQTTYAADFIPVTTPKSDLLPGPPNGIADNGDALIDQVIPKFTVRLIGLIGGIAVLFLVIAGVRYVTSYTNEETHAKAKEQIIYTLVGLIIAVLAVTIVSIIVNINFTPQS